MQTAKALIWLGGCPGWSESSLGAQVIFWFCRAVAEMRVQHKTQISEDPCSLTSLCSPHGEALGPWLPMDGIAKTLIRLHRLMAHSICKVCTVPVPIIPALIISGLTYEPCHDKTCFCHMRTTKAQISLHIRAVWSAPLLFTAWIVEYLYLPQPKFQDPR